VTAVDAADVIEEFTATTVYTLCEPIGVELGM
jgi:hypothetical protein